MARKRRSGGRKSNSNVLLGLALTSTAEPIVDQLASSVGLNISDDILKIGVGWWLSKKTGWTKGIGYGLVARGSGNVVGNLLTGLNIGGARQSNQSGGEEVY